MSETIFTNATLILPDALMPGTLVVRGGVIAEVQPGRVESGIDLDGDYVMPGVVDVHTDNLERQVMPRIGARWPSRSAMIAHDAQCAAAGVTSVLDALCLGDLAPSEQRVRTFRDALVDLDALAHTDLLKSDHFLHLRCELPAVDMAELVDSAADHPLVRMVSLMDHTPGVGQYADLDAYRARRREEGHDPAKVEARITRLLDQRARMRTPNRDFLLGRVAGRGIALASHDDRTEQEVADNHALGIRISEFPVTLEAARAARARGMQTIAGAPNIVRGGSHSGNVSAAELVREDTVDAFASDYVPASLVEAAFLCGEQTGISLPQAIGLVTDRPAAMAGLADRGRLSPGLRADLVRVRVHGGMPVVLETWRAGKRVA